MDNTIENIIKRELLKKGHKLKYITEALKEIKYFTLEQITYLNEQDIENLKLRNITTLEELLNTTQQKVTKYLKYKSEIETFFIINKIITILINKLKQVEPNTKEETVTLKSILIKLVEDKHTTKEDILKALPEIQNTKLNQIEKLPSKIIVTLEEYNITTLKKLLNLTKEQTFDLLGLNSKNEDDIYILIDKIKKPLINKLNELKNIKEINDKSLRYHTTITTILNDIQNKKINNYLQKEIQLLELIYTNETNKKSTLNLDKEAFDILKIYINTPKPYEEIATNLNKKTKIIQILEELINFKNKTQYLCILEKNNITLEDLNISEDLNRIIKRNNITTIRDLLLHSEEDLNNIFLGITTMTDKILKKLNNKNIILLNDKNKLKETLKLENAGLNHKKQLESSLIEKLNSIINSLKENEQFKHLTPKLKYQKNFDQCINICHEEIIKILNNNNSEQLIIDILNDICINYTKEQSISEPKKNNPLNKEELKILKKYILNFKKTIILPNDNKTKLCILNIYIELQHYINKIKYKRIIKDKNIKIEDLDLNKKTLQKIKFKGINTLEELIDYSETEITNINGIGQKTLDYIKEALQQRNIIFLNKKKQLEENLKLPNAGIITKTYKKN